MASFTSEQYTSRRRSQQRRTWEPSTRPSHNPGPWTRALGRRRGKEHHHRTYHVTRRPGLSPALFLGGGLDGVLREQRHAARSSSAASPTPGCVLSAGRGGGGKGHVVTVVADALRGSYARAA